MAMDRVPSSSAQQGRALFAVTLVPPPIARAPPATAAKARQATEAFPRQATEDFSSDDELFLPEAAHEQSSCQVSGRIAEPPGRQVTQDSLAFSSEDELLLPDQARACTTNHMSCLL